MTDFIQIVFYLQAIFVFRPEVVKLGSDTKVVFVTSRQHSILDIRWKSGAREELELKKYVILKSALFRNFIKIVNLNEQASSSIYVFTSLSWPFKIILFGVVFI